MKKEILLIFIIFLISLNFVASENKVDNIIEEKLLTQEKVKVIIILEESKENALEKLEKKDFKKKREFSIVNGFSGEVSKEGLEKLKKDNSISKIYYDYPVKAFLQDSLPLINASITHNLQLNNINITGNTETICIIDTGINYTHESLGKCSNEEFLDGNCSKVIGGYDFVNNDEDPYDDSGHGTHVSGIAAANGNIIGVAPDAKIIAIKALDNNGEGFALDVIAGIDWCVNNASQLNISVISMSLGSETEHNSYCNDDVIAPYINSAISKGIIVAVAAGNCNWGGANCSNGIAAPACVENATPVGAVDNNDLINFQRGNILDLLAPGLSITAPFFDGSTTTKSGTSMAAPHVAGAIALLQQFNKLQNGTSLTPPQIEEVLDNTGKLIDDSNNSGYNFSRIDVYEAIQSLEDGTPRITINLNSDILEYNQQNLTINISYTDSFLDSHKANITYPNKTLLTDFTTNLELTPENLTQLGSYTIIAWANDTNGNENLTSKIFLVRDTTGLNNESFTINYPNNNNFTGNNLVFFNITITSKYNLTNISLYHNYSLWNVNETFNLDTNQTTVEFNSSFPEGIYLWSLKACDLNNYCVFYDNRTLFVDLSNPVVYATNKTSYSTNNIVFHYNVTDYSIDNCKLFINDIINGTTNDISTGIDQTFNRLLHNGNYNWSVNCTDRVGNIGTSDTIFTSVSCSESWSCSTWGSCNASGYKHCTAWSDSNSCGIETNKPSHESSTSGCTSNDDTGDGTNPPSGDAATTTTSETESVLAFSGDINDVKTFGISKDVGITGISITLKNPVSNAKLTVKKLESKPSNIPSLNNINRYIQIDITGLNNDDIKEAIIKFKVAKTWISENADSSNHIFMHRYNNDKWEKLDTLTAGIEEDYQKYQATTPGFSYFAINAEKTTSPLPTTTPEKNITENNIKEETNITTPKKSFFNFKNLFSGNVIKNKLNIKNLLNNNTYNIIFITVILLMLIALTYKYKDTISKFKKSEIKKIKHRKLKPNFSKVKFKFDNFRKHIKTIQEKRARIKTIAKKTKIAKIKAKKKIESLEKAKEKAKLERFEIKDRNKENWENFDLESGWDEGN